MHRPLHLTRYQPFTNGELISLPRLLRSLELRRSSTSKPDAARFPERPDSGVLVLVPYIIHRFFLALFGRPDHLQARLIRGEPL